MAISRSRPEQSPLRLPAAACATVAALAHVPVTGEHLAEATYIGVLFIVLEMTLLAVAVVLVVADTPLAWTVAGVVPALAVAAYAVSRSVGLPQIGDDVGNWAEPLGVVSVGFEALLVLLVLVRHRRFTLGTDRRWAPAAVSLLLLIGGMVATSRGVDAQASGHTHHGVAHDAAVSGGYWDEVAGGGVPSGGRTRQYYVSADPVVWDYTPRGRNLVTLTDFDENAAVFTGSGPGRIGSRYLKCLYRGYSDAGFRHLQSRPAEDRYLGMLGPVIRAEVGDTIRVVFRNRCPFPTSMHPHGVFYDKDSEGAPYADGTRGPDKRDDAVPTGGRHVYTWQVPGRAGPGPHDGSSVMWMYHGHTDEVTDTYAGLIGPMVVTAKGQALPDAAPADVDRELFTMFFIDNETASPLLAANIKRFGTPPMPGEPEADEEFVEHNLKHSINGYLFGNMPMINLHRGERVRWYVMGMGTEVDLHTPHWHGNTVSVGGMRMDVVDLLPASMVVADMVPDDPGTWLFHCHVNDHLSAGMIARYHVVS